MDPSQAPAPFEGRPIILDRDVPCPQCGYNLRGLVEPRCPECGFGFEPRLLLEQYEAATGEVRTLWWYVKWMYRDPECFWGIPAIGFGRGLSLRQVAAVLLIATSPALFIRGSLLAPKLAWPCGDSLERLVGWMVAILLATSIHGALCCVALHMAGNKRAVDAADMIVRCSLVWVMPLLWSVVAIEVGHAGQFLSLAPLGLVAAFGFLWAFRGWARALYHGGHAVWQGSRSLGVWCVVSGLLSYIVVAAAWSS